MAQRHSSNAAMQDNIRRFRDYTAAKGLKNTPQRQLIMETFMSADGHLSAEDLYAKVKKLDPSLGQATVYRTMKLLRDAGLAREMEFGDGFARYEPVGEEHHDHLICESCGLTIEVIDENIESLQEKLAIRHGFRPTRHRLYLYGICPQCRKKEKENGEPQQG